MKNIVTDIEKRKKKFALKHNTVHLSIKSDATELMNKGFEGVESLREDASLVETMVSDMGYLWQQGKIYVKLMGQLEDHLQDMTDMEDLINDKAEEIGMDPQDILPNGWDAMWEEGRMLHETCQTIVDNMRVEFQWKDL